MWWIPEEHCQNKMLTELFQCFFFLFPTILDFRKFNFSDTGVFLKAVLAASCYSPVVGAWSEVSLQSDGLYCCCSCMRVVSDECKEMFFLSVQMFRIHVLAQEVSLVWCMDHRGVTYTCHCRRALHESLQGPSGALCVSRMFMCSIYLP